MKVAVIEKCPSKNSFDFFDFDFDILYLSSRKLKKLLVKDIDLDIPKVIEEYDLIVTVGAEPTKHVAKTNSVTSANGVLVKEKFVPMINPAIAIFKPDQSGAVKHAVKTVESIVTGEYKQYKGEYYHITRASTALKYIQKVLRASEIKYVAMDTETTGLYPRNGHVLGISISHKEQFGVYIDHDCIDENVEEALQELCEEKTIVFHNAKFDMHMLKFWFKLKFYDWEDTMMIHYLLNENEPHGLKFLAGKYTDMGNYEASLDEFKKDYCKRHKMKIGDFSYDLVPPDILAEYAAADTDATITLFNKFWPTLVDSVMIEPYNVIMKPGLLALMSIEDTGVPFNVEELKRAQKEYDSEIKELKDKLYDYDEVHTVEKQLEVVFNPNSTAHLRHLLFKVLGLPIISRTKKGEPSTDKETLSELSSRHPCCDLLMQIRQKTKIKTTYLDKTLANLDSDVRIRSNFNQCVATSGRLSSSGKMNFQQMPRDDKTFKNCIQHPDPDWYIFSQDLKTAEAYVAAVVSKDPKMQEVFKSGGDLHSTIAKIVFRIDIDVDKIKGHPEYDKYRQASKAVTFGILFGASAKTVAKSATEDGADLTTKEAQYIIDHQYFGVFKKLKKYIENQRNQLESKACLYSVFNRKRRVPNVFSSDNYEKNHALNSGFNFGIQSVASDINLLAFIDFMDWLEENPHIRCEVYMLVHDSIIGAVHKDDAKIVRDKLKELTQKDRGVSIEGCPIGVDFEIGSTYAFKDEEEVKELCQLT